MVKIQSQDATLHTLLYMVGTSTSQHPNTSTPQHPCTSTSQHLFYLRGEFLDDVVIRLGVVTRLLHLVTQRYLDECHIKDFLVVLRTFISLGLGVHSLRYQTGGIAVERFGLRTDIHRHVCGVDVEPYA